MIAGIFTELLAKIRQPNCGFFWREIPPIAVLLMGALHAQDASLRLAPVTKDEVSQTITAELRARGVPGDELPQSDDIELPVAVPAAVGRTLRVAASCWDENLSRAQFRLECRQAGHCLPFFAYVHARPSAPGGNATGRACQTVSASGRARSVARRPVIRTGDRVAVVYHGSRMRLTTVVTCLDRGAEGDVIRVRNQDGHIFRARVSTATLLEALP